MNALIIVTDEHKAPVPLIYNLGNHSLVITNSYGDLAAFEFAAPSTDEGTTQELTILDHDETYNLYQCLHELFHPKS